jgi:hypothetical protein
MLSQVKTKLRAYDSRHDDKVRMDLRLIASALWLAAADLAQYVLAVHHLAPFSGEEERDIKRAEHAASTPEQYAAIRVARKACLVLYFDLFLSDEGTIEEVEDLLPQVKLALEDLEDELERSR